MRIHRNSVVRLISVLHHLALALDQRDTALSYSEKGIKAAIGADNVGLEIGESRSREKHVPTPAERKRHEEHERRREIVVGAHRDDGNPVGLRMRNPRL
jgi:hypothetical protein